MQVEEALVSYPAPPQLETQAQLRERVADLEQQVLELQRKLDALHATDVNSLRRAYQSLKQHVQALDVESKHISTLLARFDTDLVTPQFVAQEVGVVASATGAVWVVDRTLRIMQVPLSGVVTRVALTAALGYLALRFLRTGGDHVRQFFRRNKGTKEELQRDWQMVRQRVDIMSQLTNYKFP